MGSKLTRLNIYKTLTRPVLAYGSEAWKVRTADKKRLSPPEIKFLRSAGYTALSLKYNKDF
jgi:hypothetical protein